MEKVLLIKDDKIGDGELGGMVSDGFLSAIADHAQNKELRPRAIVFLNRGVLFGEPGKYPTVFEALQKLQDLGVELEFCKGCVEHFGLEKKLGVGRINDAKNISALLLQYPVLSL
ncbi:hypothetical protein [Helicobacter mustelae]|uniref:Uncharacterized protein n=1 Tax=Helicobacter mustelae (strain ATCC 43772 / CCUG 25715 / CIP 103759 / LMG 18044 / NCTC 12198 / R85-136P) TaxID=679897 RepID=D3UHV8_HELM1|nr:hypothetical protein [Helicobacter mustelae]CBG40081.1 Putative hypothetical protein [Helicobacter mustelae 12198]SQH71595.1 putative selenium metabolism protein [Helicobacter mustelae]